MNIIENICYDNNLKKIEIENYMTTVAFKKPKKGVVDILANPNV